MRRKILVIEDNRDLADGLMELMELHDHEVDVAFTGAEGLEAAARKKYDVLFVDIGLPDIDGVECVRRLRESGAASRVLLMTGYSAKDIPARIRELEGAELLTKPIDPAVLLSRIE